MLFFFLKCFFFFLLVSSPDHTLRYVKVGLVTLVDLIFFSAGIRAEPIILQDGQLLRNMTTPIQASLHLDNDLGIPSTWLVASSLPSSRTASIKAAFFKARIPELTAVVLPDFRTDSLATVCPTKSGLHSS